MSTPSPVLERFPFRTWIIAFSGWLFDFYDLVLFSYLLVPIGKDLQLTETQEGILLGVALGASGIGGILFGYLSDRFGRKRVLTWTVCLFSVGTGLTAFATGPLTMFLFRLLTGLGVGGEWAVGHALLGESIPKHLRGRGAAALQAGEPLGVGLAAVMGLLAAPWLGSRFPTFQLWGTNAWRLIFLASSATAALALLARYALPESAVWDRQRSEQFSPAAALQTIVRARLGGALLRSWLLGVFKLGTYWTCYIWLPKFLQTDMHQPVGQSLLWILTTQVGQLLGMLAFGWFADHLGRRWSFTAYSLLTAAAIYPLAFHWQELVLEPLWFGLDLFVLGLGSGCTAGFGALLAELFPTSVRNFAMGTTYNGARMVQFGMPALVGLLVLEHGLGAGLSVPLVLALATAGWVWTLPETRGRDLAHIATE